jgi:DNA primase
MFPIRSVKGETIGFGGRILDQGEPKYLNSPETPLFSKGRELYGLWEGKDAIRKAGYVLVTEGYMDVVALAQMGFEQAVATLGTACTPDHVHKLFRFTDQVIFSFDGDKAGRRAARKALDGALPYATDTRSVKFLFLPPEHDPDSFIRELGAEAFGHAVQQATPLSRFLTDTARDGCEMETAEGRAQMLAAAKPLWALLPEGSLRIQLLNEFASMAQMSPSSLKDVWGLNTPPPQPNQKAPGLSRYQEYSSGYSKNNGSGANSLKNGRFGARAEPANALGGVTRGQAPTRAERLVQLALQDHGLMQRLSETQMAMLAALPSPCGPLLGWLEGQLHDVGVQSWAGLHQALQTAHGGSPISALATRLMTNDLQDQVVSSDVSEGAVPRDEKAEQQSRQAEFSDALRRLQLDALKAQQTQLVAAFALDPSAKERYKETQAQIAALESAARKPLG